jgi:hypothetical protein
MQATAYSLRLAVLGSGFPPRLMPGVRRWTSIITEVGIMSSQSARPPANAREARSIRELLFHVDNVFHSRVNFLLVAESVFFAALSQVWSNGGVSINVLLCLLGIVITGLLWLPMNALQRRSKILAARLSHEESPDAVYRDYLASIRDKLKSTYRLANWLPSAFLLGWIGVLVLLAIRQCSSTRS